MMANTRDFKYPHRKKSQGERSGDLGGQAISPKRLINFPGKSSRTFVIESLAECAVAVLLKMGSAVASNMAMQLRYKKSCPALRGNVQR